jgi:hypothetical protein
MAAGSYNFTIEQGATFTKTITWKDASGTPINLTGYAIAGKIRRKASDPASIISFTTTISNQTTNPGQFVISLTAAQTATLPTATGPTAKKVSLECAYDIEASLSGVVYRLLEGIVKISPEVTR